MAFQSILDAAMAYPVREFTSDIEIVPNDTLHILWHAPRACTVVGIKLYYQTLCTSAAGTYLFTVSGAGNNLISTANLDLEGPSPGPILTAATLYSATLTGTAANLDLAAGAKVDFAFASNNADLTGGTGGYVQLLYVGR